jgi:hypothetical protein
MKLSFSLATVIVFSALVLWFVSPLDYRVLLEALRPTTVEMLPIPDGCVATDAAPPPTLMKVVEQQKSFYHLKLQKVVVCKTTTRLSPDFPSHTLHGIGAEQWLPLYVGCSSYQHRRHVVVEVASVDETGSVVAQAALVQCRWDFLRAKWRGAE